MTLVFPSTAAAIVLLVFSNICLVNAVETSALKILVSFCCADFLIIIVPLPPHKDSPRFGLLLEASESFPQMSSNDHIPSVYGFTVCPLAIQGSFETPNDDCVLQASLSYSGTENFCTLDEVDASLSYPPLYVSASTGSMQNWTQPVVVMIDQTSDCMAVQQVMNAQVLGASGVLLVEPQLIRRNFSSTIAMNISIPSYYVSQSHIVDSWKQALMNNQTITVEMSWNVTKVDYFHLPSPYRGTGQDLPIDLQQALKDLNVKFLPRFFLRNWRDLGCSSDEFANAGGTCSERCTNFGRYCANDPDNTTTAGISGIDIIKEVLRRMCVWNLYGANSTDLIGSRWWSYVEAFQGLCTTEKQSGEQFAYNLNFTAPECIYAAVSQAGLDYTLIEQCVNETGSLNADGTVDLLEQNLRAVDAFGVSSDPSLFVDSLAYPSENSPEVLLDNCGRYTEEQIKPPVCTECIKCVDDFKCLIDGLCSKPQDDGQSTGTASPTAILENLPFPAPTNAPVISTAPTTGFDGVFVTPHGVYANSTAPSPNNTIENERKKGVSGLNDSAKVVIVVAVVGGVILLIFGSLLLLLWKLFVRIQTLEKSDKRTRTTTSPLDSFIVDVPFIIDSDDPFGQIVSEDYEAVPNDYLVTPATPATSPTTAKPPTSLISEAEVGNVMAPTVAYIPYTSADAGEEQEGLATEDPEDAANNIRIEMPTSLQLTKAPDNVTQNSDIAKTKKPWWLRDVTAIGVDASPPSVDARARQDRKMPWWESEDDGSEASVVEIMGREAPEAKKTRRQLEDEEKSEIEEIRYGPL